MPSQTCSSTVFSSVREESVVRVEVCSKLHGQGSEFELSFCILVFGIKEQLHQQLESVGEEDENVCLVHIMVCIFRDLAYICTDPGS